MGKKQGEVQTNKIAIPKSERLLNAVGVIVGLEVIVLLAYFGIWFIF